MAQKVPYDLVSPSASNVISIWHLLLYVPLTHSHSEDGATFALSVLPRLPPPTYFGLLIFIIKRLPTYTFFEKLCLSFHPSYPLLSVVSLAYVLMALYIVVIIS